MAGINDKDGDALDDQFVSDTGDLSNHEGGVRIDDDIYIPPRPSIVGANASHINSRLVVKKIVNINFKSYVGQVTIGPFHERFSAIVGPNGSGKSNIIDSMLFVFGFRANKIRSKRISELIHNSSEHPNVCSCTVQIHFCKIVDKGSESSIEIIPGSDTVIGKTAFKDNTSYYELNGRKVQFKEISKFLRDDGVDLDHNRFLILQGEIEQIALMRPKGLNEHDCGMLEFLEDIIGTSRLKLPLEQLSAKVELLNDHVIEKFNRLRIVERERGQLKDAMEEAVNYLKLENNITVLKYKFFNCKRFKNSTKLQSEEKNQQKILADNDKLKTQMEDISHSKKLKIEELQEKSEKWSTVQQKSDSMSAIFDTIRKKDEALHAELVETNKRRKYNKNLISSETAKLEQLNNIPDKNIKEIKECENLVEKHVVTLGKEEKLLESLMSSSKEKTKPLLKKRLEFETKLIVHRKNIDQAQAKFDIAASELQLYTSLERSERKKYDQLTEITRKTSETLKNRKSQLAIFETSLPATEVSLQKARKKFEEMRQKDIKLSADIKQMRMQLEDKKLILTRTKSWNKIIDALMMEKRIGRIPGIFGRLGDLGAINIKYDIAISTACGPLDNVVVDTADTAQACIQFLRVNNIGRATFIALDKVNRLLPYCKQKIITPENVPRLFDLINVEDERVLPAFYYGLQDTLVANDLEQATRIAYGKRRRRVVTFKGELIETSGTMSGGGRTTFKGRMGQSVVKNDRTAGEIEDIERTLAIVQQECFQLRSEQKAAEKEIDVMSMELREMTINKNKFDIEVKTLCEQLPELKSQLKIQEKKVTKTISNPERVKELTNTVEMAKIELEKVKEQSKTIEKSVVRINKEIDEITGNSVKSQQKKIVDLTKAIDKARGEICRLQVAIKTASRNTQKAEQSIETLRTHVGNCEQRIRDIQKEKHQCEDDAKGLLKILDECAKVLAERDQITGSLKEEIIYLQKKEDKMKAIKIDLDQKLADSRKIIADLSLHVNQYKQKLSNLKLNAIPGEDVETLQELGDNEILALNSERLAEDLAMAKENLPDIIPNMEVINEYMEKNKIYIARSAELTEATNKRNKMRANYEMIKKCRYDEFFVGFSIISSKLKEMYQMITLGGAAELEFVDSLDPFTEGVLFSVRPPKKSWKNIHNLSGGEKTLSSLALVFALHHYKPTPLYFMDEIDAALDFKNVSIVGTYIKERTKNAQFIVISLRSEMFELADSLVGIYKTYNSTKCISFNVIKFYQNHPELALREKVYQERRTERYQIKRSPIVNKKLVATQPQLMHKTCPPRILHTPVTISTKNKDEAAVEDKDNSREKVQQIVRNVTQPSPKQRRAIYCRKYSTSSDAISSSSSSVNSNENNTVSIKKRKMS